LSARARSLVFPNIDNCDAVIDDGSDPLQMTESAELFIKSSANSDLMKKKPEAVSKASGDRRCVEVRIVLVWECSFTVDHRWLDGMFRLSAVSASRRPCIPQVSIRLKATGRFPGAATMLVDIGCISDGRERQCKGCTTI